MEMNSMMIAVSNFALFTFISILISLVDKKELRKKFSMLILSSFFMFLFTILLFFMINSIQNHSESSFVLTFFAFFSIQYALFILAKMIMDLYSSTVTLKWKLLVFYGLFSGVVFSIIQIFGDYFWHSNVVIFLLVFPFYYMIKGIIYGSKPLLRTPFFYQIVILVIFYFLKLINLYTLSTNISLDSPNHTDVAYTSISIIVIITFYISYMVEEIALLYNQSLTDTKLLQLEYKRTVEQSEMDALTGLCNRKKIYSYLNQLYQKYELNQQDFSFMMIDVNFFKNINDTLGHQTGDDVLIFISRNLEKAVRENDLVGRWGGDEFVIVYPNTSNKSHRILLEKLQETFNSIFCESIGDYISLSTGISSIDDSFDLNDMIARADQKMYQEKERLKSNETKK